MSDQRGNSSIPGSPRRGRAQASAPPSPDAGREETGATSSVRFARVNRPTPYEALAEALAEVVRDAVADAIARMADHPSMADETAFVGVPEAARRLNLGETTTKREIAAGRLRSVLLGRRRLVPVDAIAEFAQALAADGQRNDEPSGEAS